MKPSLETDLARRRWPIGAAGAASLAAAPAAQQPPYRLALALCGGCIRAFAHVGVIKALADADVRPDLVVGASSGSLVGALYCAAPDAAALERLALSLRWGDLERWRPSKYGF